VWFFIMFWEVECDIEKEKILKEAHGG